MARASLEIKRILLCCSKLKLLFVVKFDLFQQNLARMFSCEFACPPLSQTSHFYLVIGTKKSKRFTTLFFKHYTEIAEFKITQINSRLFKQHCSCTIQVKLSALFNLQHRIPVINTPVISTNCCRIISL